MPVLVFVWFDFLLQAMKMSSSFLLPTRAWRHGGLFTRWLHVHRRLTNSDTSVTRMRLSIPASSFTWLRAAGPGCFSWSIFLGRFPPHFLMPRFSSDRSISFWSSMDPRKSILHLISYYDSIMIAVNSNYELCFILINKKKKKKYFEQFRGFSSLSWWINLIGFAIHFVLEEGWFAQPVVTGQPVTSLRDPELKKRPMNDAVNELKGKIHRNVWKWAFLSCFIRRLIA